MKIEVEINTYKDNKNDIHVIPEFNLKKKHKSNVGCWCRPLRKLRNKKSGGSVYAHFINGSKRK